MATLPPAEKGEAHPGTAFCLKKNYGIPLEEGVKNFYRCTELSNIFSISFANLRREVFLGVALRLYQTGPGGAAAKRSELRAGLGCEANGFIGVPEGVF